jgi:hypothetical protein
VNDLDNHISESLLKYFEGNFLYSSANQMSFMATSRRDDLISLFYLLIKLLNKNELLDWNERDNQHTMAQKFEKLINVKTNTSLIEMTR